MDRETCSHSNTKITEIATVVTWLHPMHLVATSNKLTAWVDQHLQACIHAVALAIFARIHRTGLSFDCGIHRMSALQLTMMMMLGKEQLSGLWVCPESLCPYVSFHLRSRFTLLFHAVVFSPLCCDPASSVFASKCLGEMSCHDGCSVWSRGSWLGGSLVSALSFVAYTLKRPSVILSMFCLLVICGPASWHISCHLHVPRRY